MIVKNPTGITQNYEWSLSLAAGATADIDNSYIENIDFQEAIANTTISVLKYDKDFVSNTVVISMATAPNTPSSAQKGAMVAANTPSVLNPFVTIKDTHFYDCRLERLSATQVQLVGIASRQIWIGNVNTVLAIPISCNLSVQYAIDSTGNLTGSVLPPSTIGYIYVSNKYASLGDKLLRPSTVVPTFHEDGLYLNATRDWLFVGYVQIDLNNELASTLCVKSEYNGSPRVLLLNGFVGTQDAIVANTIESITDIEVTVLSSGHVHVSGTIEVSSTVSTDSIEIFIDSVKVAQIVGGGMVPFLYHDNVAPLTTKTYVLGMRGPGTDHQCIKDTTTMSVVCYE